MCFMMRGYQSCIYFCTIIVYTAVVSCQNEKPSFRILAPQFICGAPRLDPDDPNPPPVSPPGMTTVRLQTSPGQQLNYNWSVRFNVLNGPRGQRFNLLVWRAVRSLEKLLDAEGPLIAETNMVAINNSMLIEGVNYVFNITGVNEKGVVGDTRSFALKFTDAKSDPKINFDGVEDEQFSAIILASPFTYADIDYVVEMQTTSCNPTNDYYFSWKVVKMDDKTALAIEPERGKKLTIPAGKLIGGLQYDVRCVIYKITTDKQLATSGIFIRVLTKGAFVEMNVDRTTAVLNAPIALKATLKNPDNLQGTIEYVWSCKNLNDSQACENFKSLNSSDLFMEKGLQKEATYQFSVSITKGDTTVSSSAILIVQNAMLPTIIIDQTPIVTASNKVLEIPARVLDLRSLCNMSWTSVPQEGYQRLEQEGMGGSVSINNLEETFLSELVEFGNETTQRSFPLILKDLKPDAQYKFRLMVTCACSSNMECFGPKNVTAMSDVIVMTNAAPVLNEIKVKPTTGEALKTKFTFSTKAAVDLRKDYPLTYKFGFKGDDGDITLLTNLLESLSTETVLPYSPTPLLPTLTVCDARGACSSIDGPPVTVKQRQDISQDEIQFYMDTFEKELYRKEYRDAFNGVSMLLTTFKLQKDQQNYLAVMNSVEDLVKKDVSIQIGEVKNGSQIIKANEFIQAAVKFVEKLEPSDSFFQTVLQLRDELYQLTSPSQRLRCGKISRNRVQKIIRPIKRRASIVRVESNRQKREITTDRLENYVKMSEHVILTSDAKEQVTKEKKNVLSMLDRSSVDLCKERQNFLIEWKTISFKLEGTTSPITNEAFYIPYASHPSRKIKENVILEGQTLAESRQSAYCITKTYFSMNFLDEDAKRRGKIYQYSIYDSNLKMMSDFGVILKIPIEDISLEENEKLKCSIWNNKFWSIEGCQTNDDILINENGLSYIVCKCDSLGFFSLYAVEKEKEVIKTTANPITGVVIADSTTVDSACSNVDYPCTTTTSEEYKAKKPKENDKKIKPVNKYDSVPTSAWVPGLLISLIVIVVIILYKVCRKKEKSSEEGDSSIRFGPKYGRFHDEHLMEGSMESLGNTIIYRVFDIWIQIRKWEMAF